MKPPRAVELALRRDAERLAQRRQFAFMRGNAQIRSIGLRQQPSIEQMISQLEEE